MLFLIFIFKSDKLTRKKLQTLQTELEMSSTAQTDGNSIEKWLLEGVKTQKKELEKHERGRMRKERRDEQMFKLKVVWWVFRLIAGQ